LKDTLYNKLSRIGELKQGFQNYFEIRKRIYVKLVFKKNPVWSVTSAKQFKGKSRAVEIKLIKIFNSVI